jgi:acyl carrier protein
LDSKAKQEPEMIERHEGASNENGARRMALSDALKRILIERLSLRIDPDQITNDAPLFETGLGLDSVDALEIAVAVETEFGVPVTEADIAELHSINRLADFIIKRQPEQGTFNA